MNIWKFDDVDLSTIGVITLLDDYLDLPNKRGSNQKIPFQDGTEFVEKYYDERVIQMGMTITAADADALETALDTLRALLSSRSQKILSRTLTDTSIQTVLASVEKRLQVARPAPWVAKLVIEFELSSPFFSSDTLSQFTDTINASPFNLTVNNPGTAANDSPIITLAGPLENTLITNTTNGDTLVYTGVIAGGDSVVIARTGGQWTALLNGVTSVIGNVSHSGGASFMTFEVGDNDLVITDDDATSGSVTVEFYPAYM